MGGYLSNILKLCRPSDQKSRCRWETDWQAAGRYFRMVTIHRVNWQRAPQTNRSKAAELSPKDDMLATCRTDTIG